MKARILSEHNLEKIVERLVTLPIHNWNRKDRSYTRMPSGPDSTDFEKKVHVLGYKASLESFSFEFVLEDNDYYLRVFEGDDEKPLESYFEPSYNPGVVCKFFANLEEKYEVLLKQSEIAFIERFNNAINLPRPNR